MFLIRSSDGRYYTGRAGEAFLGPCSEAFGYKNRAAAEYRAGLFSVYGQMNGVTFKVVRQ